ncbi:ABC transporter substrate-binding protein [Nocardioides pelophilus]|uniref:ABC transporter substrate-binding protein n=1 Tax=Nocardioides pelophilus TaxID=2172019 RepID=UPI0016006E16|nr:ABC transporter substrate-binding protein [Nocardioides pelophilus]
MGLVLALSGPGSYYGKVQANGAKLAAAQIKAAGGPDFQIVLKDHKSGDTQAGVQVTRELGQEGVHFALYSYFGVVGSALPGIEQYKILSLDGGGGTGVAGKGKPYFYGSRANTPHDSYDGVAQFIKQAHPDAKTVALAVSDYGPAFTDEATQLLEAALEKQGLSLVTTEVLPVGSQDYSSSIAKLQSSGADVISLGTFGNDTGYFLKSLKAAGDDTPVIGAEYTSDLKDVAGAAADNYTFASDYFNAASPDNDWGKYFVESYTKAYPGADAPDFYAADYYEDMFTFWQVLQRLDAEGKKADNPDDVLAAFTSDLAFPSVYGVSADGKPYGIYAFDASTHAPKIRQMGVYQFDGTAVKPLATFGIGGADFQMK